MSRNRNNYPFHNAPIGASDRSLLVMELQRKARERSRNRYWRNVGWMVLTALGAILFTVFMYSRIGA